MIDMDGTLMPSRKDGRPSKKVISAISVASLKIHIGVATSRPYFMVKDIVKDLKLTCPSIINGGAQVYNMETHEVLWERTIKPKPLKELISYLINNQTPFIINDNGQDVEFTRFYKPFKPFQGYIPHIEENKAERIIDDLSKVPGLSVIKVNSWANGKVDVAISDSLSTKQHGIFEVCKILQIDNDEIIGVGDGYNDFPLLMACGLKIAMGNAVEDLKAIADYIAPTVEEDGVVDVINRFVL